MEKMRILTHFFYFSSNNRGMQWYIIVILVLFVLLFLSILPLCFNARTYINLRENLGAVSLNLFGLPILCFQFKLNKTAITIIKRKGKDKDIPLSIIDKDVIFAEYFIKSIFSFVYIRQVSLFFMIGKDNDAFLPAMAGGFFNSFVSALLAFLYTKKSLFPAFVGLETASNKNELKFAAEIRVIFSLMIILIGYIRAKNLTKRWLKVYERFSRAERKSNR